MAFTPAFAPLGFKGTYSGCAEATIMFAAAKAIEASETIVWKVKEKSWEEKRVRKLKGYRKSV